MLSDITREYQATIQQAFDLHQQACTWKRRSSPKERSEIIEALQHKLDDFTLYVGQHAGLLTTLEVS